MNKELGKWVQILYLTGFFPLGFFFDTFYTLKPAAVKLWKN